MPLLNTRTVYSISVILFALFIDIFQVTIHVLDVNDRTPAFKFKDYQEEVRFLLCFSCRRIGFCTALKKVCASKFHLVFYLTLFALWFVIHQEGSIVF